MCACHSQSGVGQALNRFRMQVLALVGGLCLAAYAVVYVPLTSTKEVWKAAAFAVPAVH